jgi:hypothetical protein
MKDDNDFDDQIQSDHKTASSMYEVGYGKPPLDTRWKKGQHSPNPSGRPRGVKNTELRIRELLMRDVVVTSNGKKRKKVPYIRALLDKTMRGALLGNSKDLKFILQLAETHRMFDMPPIGEIVCFTLSIPNAKKINVVPSKQADNPEAPNSENEDE